VVHGERDGEGRPHVGTWRFSWFDSGSRAAVLPSLLRWIIGWTVMTRRWTTSVDEERAERMPAIECTWNVPLAYGVRLRQCVLTIATFLSEPLY